MLNKNYKGFTLIELLVVIAIIGILAVLIIIRIVNILPQSRNARRKSDIESIKKAFDIFVVKGGTIQCYQPDCTCGVQPPPGSCGVIGQDAALALQDDIFSFQTVNAKIFFKNSEDKYADFYIQGGSFPKDPKSNNPYWFIISDNQDPSTPYRYVILAPEAELGESISQSDKWK